MKTSFLIKFMSVVLVLATLLTALPLSVFAEAAGSIDNPAASSNEVYIKEVQLAQADSAAEAKKMLEGEGFIFVSRNLNEGTREAGVWLGYKTTTDPTEAIYDMKMMNTKGGYTLTSMEAALESQKSNFTQMAKDLNDLVEEFAEAYNEGSVAAQKAYMALNMFRIVDDSANPQEENGLGYQFLNGKMSLEKMTELLLFCDATVLDSIVKNLTMGILLQSENWMQRLSKLGPYDSETQYAEDETELKERAKQLLVVFDVYAQTYNAMDAMGLFKEEGETTETPTGKEDAENAGEKGSDKATPAQKEIATFDIARVELYKAIFAEFEKYTYGNGTLKDFVVSLAHAKNEKALYPLVSFLTDGEFAAFSFGCFIEMTLGATMTASDFDAYDEEFTNATKDIKPFYIYEGINPVLLQDDTVVAFTDSASRRMSLTGEYQFYEKENWGEDFWENRRYNAMAIEAVGMVVMCGAKGLMGLMSFGGLLAKAAADGASGLLVGVVKVCTFLGSATFQLIIFAAALLMALVGYIAYCIYDSWQNKIDWSKNPIPQYIYDIKEVGFTASSSDGITTEHMKKTAYVFYEVVTDVRNNPVDLNARSSDASQWIAMYVSYDRPGDDSKPIKAKDFMVSYGNGETPEGYTPATRFGEARAYNLNQWDDHDDVNGVFVFYKQDHVVTVKSDRTYYIQDVVLQSGESDAHCISLLEGAKYIPLNVNLSPDYSNWGFVSSEKVYTYLGYKLTDNPKDALTDIRLEYGAGGATKQHGGVTYAASGTSAGITLYATKYAEAGTPILAGGLICVNDRSAAPAGYEPVNFFAGGPAASFNLHEEGILLDQTDYFLYFLPQQTFTSGDVYLGGMAYHYTDEGALNKWFDAYKKGNIKTNIVSYLTKLTRKTYSMKTEDSIRQAMNDYALVRSGYHSSSSSNGLYSDSIVYFHTHNPYRAIYDIKGSNVSELPANFVFDGLGYSVWNYNWLQYFSFTPPTLSPHATKHEVIEKYTFSFNNQGTIRPLSVEGNFYVSGNPERENVYDKDTGAMSKVQPLKMSDIISLKKSDDASALTGANSVYKPVVDIFSNATEPLAVKLMGASDAHTLYTTKEVEAKPYVSGITAIDSLTLYRALGGAGAGIKRNQITDGMLFSQLAGRGATHFVDLTVTLYNHQYWMLTTNVFTDDGWETSLNKMKFGYTKTADETKALRDVFIYTTGFSVDKPPQELRRGSVTYKLLCEIPLNLTGYDGAPQPGMYLYGTTDSRAGEPILDLTFSNNPFNDEYETVRTMNGRSAWSEISEYMKDQQEKHFMEDAKTLFAELFSYLGLIHNVEGRQEHNQSLFFYIHLKREDYNLREQKPYISELYLPRESMYKLNETDIKYGYLAVLMNDLFDQGADGYVDVDLNEYNITHTDWSSLHTRIYLAYKRTADPGEAITAIRSTHRLSDAGLQKRIDLNGVVYNLVSPVSLNRGTTGDAIFLYTTKSTDPDVGSPISDILYTQNEAPSYYTTDSAEVLPVMRWDSWKPSDFNANVPSTSYRTSVPTYLLAVRPFERPMGDYVAPDYGKDKTTTRYNPSGSAEGKYLAALYVMDKNTLRQEKLAAGIPSDQCTCNQITDQEVFDRLKAMGATTIVQTPISITGGDYGNNNPNKVFIGYSRTDKEKKAIRKIVVQTSVLSVAEPKESISVDRVNYDLVAEPAKKVTTLPRAINLLGTQDGQDLLVPRMYLYTSTEGETEPIYDICIGTDPLKEGWVTVKSDSKIEPFAAIYEEAAKHAKLGNKDDSDSRDNELVYSDQLYKWMDSIADMFNPEDKEATPFYIHCKMYDGNKIEEALPYIGEIFIAEGGSRNDALSKLVAFEPDGFVDCDLNSGTWFGKHVYMAYKRTANRSEAITELAIFTGKNPAESKRLTVNGVSARFDLVANVDLNSGAGGDWLYLYATTESSVAHPIKELRISDKVVNRLVGNLFTEFTVKRADNNGFTDQDPDLNDGASGDYLYLVAKRDPDKSMFQSWMFGGSLIGDGSIETLFVLASAAAVVAVFVYSKKKGKEESEEKSAS